MKVLLAIDAEPPSEAAVNEVGRRQRGADLVIVGWRGHEGLRRLFEGSVAHYVVDHAHCPVEVVHCKDGGEESDA